jgi:DNA-directed RNA polymerase subunit RPC12/RpoP
MDPLPKFANSMSVPCLCSFRVLVRVLVLVRVRVRVPVPVPVHARDQFLNGAMKIDI